MNKLLKINLFITLFIVSLFAFSLTLKADYNFNRTYLIKNTEVTSEDILGVATRYQTTITSYNGLVVSPNKLSDHITTWIEPNLPIKDSDVRVVNYTAGTATNWQGKRPTDLAKIYEKENPGWLVIGGINGDFFHISTNSEVLGTSMQEGDFYKPYKYQGQGHAALGFFDDGRYIYGTVETTSNEYVQKLNANGVYEDVCEIKTVDKAPSSEGVTLLTRFSLTSTPYMNIPISDGKFSHDLTGYKVYVVTYEVQRLDRETKKVFVKGMITNILTDVSTLTLNDNESCSYLVCKDGSLDSFEIGDEVRCQVNATGAWTGVTNITGAYNKILENNNVVSYAGVTDVNTSYVNCNKNRTVMGFKPDGTPVIMVIEKGSYGAHYEECGEILKGIGCQNGYLFDGGGSACIFQRNPDGSFSTINKQEDGTERSDGNAVLFVVRDPGFSITSEQSRFEAIVKLNITNQAYFNNLKDIIISINGEEKPYTEDGVTFTNLEENTEYKVKVSYKLPGMIDEEKLVTGSLTSTFKTEDFSYPDPNFQVLSVGKDFIKVGKDTSLETNSWITKVSVVLGGKTYSMGNEPELLIENLLSDQEYTLYYKYTIVDPVSKREYPMESNHQTVKTKSYNYPMVVEFKEQKKTDDSVTIYYEYLDSDATVKKAYILVNEEKIELASDLGYQKISIDLKMQSYDIKLVLECEKDGDLFSVESLVLHYEKEQEQTPTQPETPQTPETPETPPVEKKKKCGKKSAELVISIITCVSLIGLAFRKRK